jgi:hypothetical protein
VRLNKKGIGDQGTETAQRRDKSKLTDLVAKPQIESNRAKMQASMDRGDRMLCRQFRGAEQRHAQKDNENPHHNSLR